MWNTVRKHRANGIFVVEEVLQGKVYVEVFPLVVSSYTYNAVAYSPITMVRSRSMVG